MAAFISSVFFILSVHCGGRPCLRGMCLRVKDVLDMLAEGAAEQEILQDYPDLEAEDRPQPQLRDLTR